MRVFESRTDPEVVEILTEKDSELRSPGVEFLFPFRAEIAFSSLVYLMRKGKRCWHQKLDIRGIFAAIDAFERRTFWEYADDTVTGSKWTMSLRKP